MKKRSSYRPRVKLADPLAWVLQGMLPVSVASTTMQRVKIANHGAMDSLIKGKGAAGDCTTLEHMLITATSLANIGIGRDWLPELATAQATLEGVTARAGSYVLKAVEITTLNTALEVHDAQLEGCTVAQLERAINLAKTAERCNHLNKKVKDDLHTKM